MASFPLWRAVQKTLRQPSEYGLRQISGWVLGPLCLLLTLLIPAPEGLSVEGWRTAGVALLMAIFWVSEALPIPATALLPLVLFPLLGLAGSKEAAAPYASPIVFLFLGGFLLAISMERWQLHRRVALHLLSAMGTSPRRIVAGFLLASGLVSMWVSNTATALMMLPIALSVVELAPAEMQKSGAWKTFSRALLLAVAYGATTGGMATLIGTPPNALLAGYVEKVYGFSIGFGQWMLLGVPIVAISLPIVYVVLTRISFRLDKVPVPGLAELLTRQKADLGPLSLQEKWVAAIFTLTAMGWITQPWLSSWIPGITDTVIAILASLALFAVPVDLRQRKFLLDWATASKVPWDVLLLFGGGLSLAAMIEQHGLSAYFGQLCLALEGWPVLLVLIAICFGILMLTELTSNTATAATFLPIAAALAIGLGENPLLFLIPVALAANCSFMLPVGTPPNAIVFGSGKITLPQMAATGFLLNIVMVPILVGLLWWLGNSIFAIDFGVIPGWVPLP